MTWKTRLHAVLRPLSVCMSAGLLVTGISVVSGPPARATPPVVTAVSTLVGQGGTGTIKGKLVWGGSEAPKPKVIEAQGSASKDPEVCAKDAPIVDQKLVVDPQTLGVRYGIVYLVKPTEDNPAAVKSLLDDTPKV